MTIRNLSTTDLFQLKYVHEAKFSPDGRQVVWTKSWTDEADDIELFDLTVEDLKTREKHAIDFEGGVNSPRWSPDGRFIAFIGVLSTGTRLYLADAASGAVNAVTDPECEIQGPPSWSPDGKKIAYAIVSYAKVVGSRRLTKRIFRSNGIGIIDNLSIEIQILDLETNEFSSLSVGFSSAVLPQFSPCGRYLMFLGSNSAVGHPAYGIGGLRLHTVHLADNEVVQVLGDGWTVSAAAWSPCGEKIIVAGDFGSDLTVPTVRLWVVDRDGRNPQCRTEGMVGNIGSRAHHDMPTWRTSDISVFIVGTDDEAFVTTSLRGCTEIWRVNLNGEAHFEAVVSGPRSCIVMDYDAATASLLFTCSDLRTPWELHIADLEAGDEVRFTQLNDAVLHTWPEMRVEHLEFESPDAGVPIEAWFMASAERQGPQPTVMFIHGGPNLATGHIFRFDLVLLASNGFGVLFANFRGSSGYGEPFKRAIMGDWGSRGFPDHIAAVDQAVARGLADPDRLGVWGPSHGGQATAWIVCHSDRFKAAVVESATTNWATKYYLSDAPGWIEQELGGRPDQVPDVYRSRSPLTFAWRCKTPTLLIHGEDDIRCPIADAEQFYRALHDANCVTELVRVVGMDHMGDSVGPLPARRAQNEALLEWFERHI